MEDGCLAPWLLKAEAVWFREYEVARKKKEKDKKTKNNLNTEKIPLERRGRWGTATLSPGTQAQELSLGVQWTR